MSEKVGDIFVVAKEPKFLCEICDSHEETRPYGRGGAEVCFPCAMKDPKETELQFGKRLGD